jgi:Reverse transcriptase (RNA-dependent DNA polymerase)/gag-polypeptide of LTR copia-type/Integrase core domain/GAG-pre-integrase domain
MADNTSDSSPPTSSLSLTSHTDNVVIITIPISQKLTGSNYLSWQCQILPTIHGYNLSKFIESPPPEQTKIGASGQFEVNPEYVIWRRQDQLLLSWLRASFSDTILAQTFSCSTTLELWNTLQQQFTSTSSSRRLELKRQLQNCKKGTLSCTDYLNQLRRIADELTFIGSPIQEEDLVMHAIQGLGVDYNPVVAAVNAAAHRSPFSFADLSVFLQSHESLLKSQSPDPSPTAFYAGSSYKNQGKPKPNYQSHYPPINHSIRSNAPPQFKPPVPPTGQLSSGNNQVLGARVLCQNCSGRIYCQICTRIGHVAKKCYSRYNQDPEWSPNPRFQAFTAQTTSTQGLLPSPNNSNNWLLDSGANNHVTSDLNNLSTFFEYAGPDKLQIGNGSGLPIAHIGSAVLFVAGFSVRLNHVLHVPNFTTNLLSLSKLLQDNPSLSINFSSTSCFLKDQHSQTPPHQLLSSNGLFVLQFQPSPQAFYGIRTTSSIWHARLCHTSNSTTLQVLNSYNLPCNQNKLPMCSDCIQAKAHSLPFHYSESVSHAPLELIHSDVWGPCSTVSYNGFRYYVTFIDHFSRFTWIFFLKQKSEVVHVFAKFKAQVENMFNCHIKTLRTDGGSEFKPITTQFPQILHQTSCPYTPQQNGTAERKHRHIVELSIATMNHASIPKAYWDEVFASVVYVINRLPSQGSVPFTTLFNKHPDYTSLRVVGSLCYPLTRPYNSSKLDVRALPCVFLGYALSQKGYKCLHLPTNKLYISRNVQFDETSFPFQTFNTTSTAEPSSTNNSSLFPQLPLLLPSPSVTNQPPSSAPSPPSLPIGTIAIPIDHIPTPMHSSISPNQPLSSHPATSPPPSHFITPIQPVSAHPMITRTKDNSRKPRDFSGYVAHLASLESEPTTFAQAKNSPHWRTAMASEMDALAKNKTWSLVPLPQCQKPIGCKWVYKIKRKQDGTIDRYKARLVAKGFNQVEGVDFFDTYSPVVRPTTIRVILSHAVASNWSIRQLDVQNAFLHGELNEQVYMSQPPGFTDPTYPDHVCLLQKSLYGLKQAPRAWFQKLSSALLAYGFKSSAYDPSLFILTANEHSLFLLVYVDDIIITGSDPQAVQSCISTLATQFAIKDLGDLHYFLGIEVHRTDSGMILTQTKYIMDLLKKVNMIDATPCLTPMALSETFSKHVGQELEDPHQFRSVVGALQYATLTRPDISFPVNKLSQFMHRPTSAHWNAVKRILRYLCGTLNHGLHITSTSGNQIHGFSDADWAGNVDDRRSTTGFCVYLGNNVVSWSAKKQPTVSRSSTEAEYRSLAVTCTEIMWLQFLLEELKIPITNPPILWCDNIGATFLASNPQFHARTKHIEIDYHFVRERIQDRKLNVRFICSADQIADCFTKPLSLPRFNALRDKLSVIPIPQA